MTVSRALGHHDAGFTLREYGQILAGAQAKVAAGLDAVVKRARGAAAESTKTLRLVHDSVLPANVPAEQAVESEAAEHTLTA